MIDCMWLTQYLGVFLHVAWALFGGTGKFMLKQNTATEKLAIGGSAMRCYLSRGTLDSAQFRAIRGPGKKDPPLLRSGLSLPTLSSSACRSEDLLGARKRFSGLSCRTKNQYSKVRHKIKDPPPCRSKAYRLGGHVSSGG